MNATYTKYKNIIIRDFLGPPEPGDLAALEEALGVNLPDSYKAFLEVANGGNLEGYYVDIDHPEMMVPRSFALLYGTKARLEGSKFGLLDHELNLSREAAQLPDEVLPLARDNSGCELYLDLTDFASLKEERVVAFIHGIPDQTNQPADNAWVTIAMTFDEFIDKLRPDEEYCLEVLQETAGKPDETRQKDMVDFLNLAIPDWRSLESFADYRDLQGAPRH